MARRFSEEGSSVALTYHSHEQAALDVWQTLAEDDGRHSPPIRMDLENPESVRGAVRDAIRELGGIDVLVNCAFRWGVYCDRVEDAAEEEWPAHLRANLESIFVLLQEASPYLRSSGTGRVVLISSPLAVTGTIGSWVYATAKSAGHGLARSLAWDLGRQGVLVNTVMPGTVIVDGAHRSIPTAELETLKKEQPSGCLPTADEVADAVVFLGSPRTRAITGTVLPVTGGTP